MMERKVPIDHIGRLKAWLATYPDLVNDVENLYGEMHIIAFDPAAAPGANMLDCTGTEVATRRDVLGDIEATYRVNYVLYVRRYANDNQFRESAAEFLSHFVHWINEERIFGTAPTFGDVDTDKEVIKATGGMKWQAVDEHEAVVDYMWQLQLNYKLLYIDD